MAYVVPAPDPVSVPVASSADRFPVRRIFCVGRNYAAHVREMGGDERDPPFYFMKPNDALVESGSVIDYPPQTSNLHYEMELVVAIGAGGRDIAEPDALDHVWGYGCGLDMTRRDIQTALRDKGRPWDMGKAFDQSAPIAPLHCAREVGHIATGTIRLTVNGETRQDSDLALMIWNVPGTIANLSGLVALAPGDLIYTGTPDGVGPVGPGDRLHGHIDGLTDIEIAIR